MKLKSLDDVLKKCDGRIDVHLIDYDTEEEPDIYIYDDVTKDEVHMINCDLTNSLEMQVYCNGELVYVE